VHRRAVPDEVKLDGMSAESITTDLNMVDITDRGRDLGFPALEIYKVH
jgi:hypothetical protein